MLSIQRTGAADRARIREVDAAVRLIDAGGWFDGEIRETWPAYSVARHLAPDDTGTGTREERDGLLAEAEVILGGWPLPLDLRARAPRLKWFHQRPAGASNLRTGDLWGSDVVVTTSRGAATRWPWRNTRWPASCTSPRALTARPSTATRVCSTIAPTGRCCWKARPCVVGAGGIGREVGRLAAALGMRVIGALLQSAGEGERRRSVG